MNKEPLANPLKIFLIFLKTFEIFEIFLIFEDIFGSAVSTAGESEDHIILADSECSGS